MSREGCLVELKPNRLLLDPSFGGYKLNLDSIPIYRTAIDSGVRVVQPGDNQYSFYHVKLFSLHNHLHVNFYKPNSVYFIDKNWKVFKITSLPPHQAFSLKEVFQIPQTQSGKTEGYNATVVFALSDIVVVSDGYGTIHLAKLTGQEEEVWEALNSDCLLSGDVACVLSDARIESVDGKRILNVLMLYVEERNEEKKEVKGSLFQTKIKWRTFVEDGSIWNESCSKELCIDGSVNYVALEAGCKSLYIISDKSPKWVYDSVNPIQVDVDMEPEPKPKIYTWTQTDEEISILVPLQPEITKSDLVISVGELEIEVKIKEKVLMSGKFFHRVSKDLTTWSLGKDHLEIQLTKHEAGLMWNSLIPGDDGGEEILDPELVKTVHERLAHLCSDKTETGSAPTFNSQQLEECDAVPCDTSSLYRINGETHATTHEVSLCSLQWLFKVSCEPGQTPAICVRHDVDACVWQFGKPEDDKTWPHEHVGTFSAFGYVQASKTQKKFLASPPNLSYVAVCEASHHIYIYRQPSPLTSELKNRHTGKKVETISKQQLVNLEAKDQILGVHATNNLLFVLLENSICLLAVNPL